MTTEKPSSAENEGRGLSLDAWAVVSALLLTLAVKLGLFRPVPW